jgi:opacity protein-like surface antigen
VRSRETGGGVWARAVGGEVDLKNASTSQVSTTSPGLNASQESPFSGPVACNDQTHSSFGGIQVGADVGNLNMNDWSVQYGVTAGSIGSRNSLVGGLDHSGAAFDSWTQVPFFGLYAAITNGSGFYADFLLRGDFYQANLKSPPLSLFNQNLNARGVSGSGSTGHNYHIPNSDWFVAPSVGLIYSNVTVDPMSSGGPPNPPRGNLAGTLHVNNIQNTIGRLGLRVGTAFNINNLVLQPFAAVSMWHDFVGSNSSSFVTCPGCLFQGPFPAQVAITYTGQNFGTYGQYSAGISGQLADTGWLGFARFDYRNGDRLVGWDLTGGLRYQFTPQAQIMGRSIAKEALSAAPPAQPLMNWSGLYAGAYAAAAVGQGQLGFVNGVQANPGLSGFLGGGQIGYNHQVIGLEGEGGGLHAKGAKACTPLNRTGFSPAAPPVLFDMTCNAEISWTATLTGRAGYAWDRLLGYVKGGAAWTHENLFVTCNLFPCTNLAGLPTRGFGVSAFQTGWTVGAGLELAITQNWSVKAEYNFIDFGKVSRTASDGTAITVGTTASVVTVGVNYHLPPEIVGF